jgi:hypothetical protein
MSGGCVSHCHDLRLILPRPRFSTLFPTFMSPIAAYLVASYNKIAAFNVENLFVRKHEPGPRRIVYVNENLPDDYYDRKGRVRPEFVYYTNQVITSKYNIFTFLPRNLLEQFRRVANWYLALLLTFSVS